MPEYRFGQHRIQYAIERSARRRSLTLIVDPQRGLIARAPLGMPDARIAEFVRLKAGWALAHLKRQELQPEARAHPDRVWYHGEGLTLEYEAAGARRPQLRLEGSRLRVGLPEDEASAPEAAGLARDHALGWLRRRAGAELRPLVARYAAELGRATPLVLIRGQVARWGSCAPDGTIRLNWRLVCLPPRLAEYVCAHECCHLVELNHSPRFWRLLARILPDYASRRRELRDAAGRYGT